MLTQQQLDQLQSFGAMLFDFEDALLHLDLDNIEGEDLKLAEKEFKRGRIDTEIQSRKNLLVKAKNGDVGATRELLKLASESDSDKKKVRGFL